MIYISIGMVEGIDTLSSQVFAAKNYYVANWFQNKARVIITVSFIFQTIKISKYLRYLDISWVIRDIYYFICFKYWFFLTWTIYRNSKI